MRSFFYLSLLAFAVCGTGCMKRYAPTGLEHRLSSLPTPFHGKEVDVFFPGERPADTAFVKVAILEQKATGNAVPYSTLVNAIKAKAKLQGMDAVLLLNKNQSTHLEREGIISQILSEAIAGRDLEPEYSSVTTHELAGIGIKYKKNLHYLPEYVKSKTLYQLRDGQQVLLGTVPVDQEGIAQEFPDASPDAENLYSQFVLHYDLPHLLHEKGLQWRFTAVQGRVVKRKLQSLSGNLAQKRVKINYNALLLPEEMVLLTGEEVQPEVIRLTYNDRRQVIEKKVFRGEQLYVREAFSYHTNGKLESILHHIIENGQETPFLKTQFDYYQPLVSAHQE
ncbi:hypothetical protein ACD591_07860 [Rufibacter glacialis]|uniref:Uncharacterized protein n=1 Tax=Rufibacter glacialis TaxID=1259555 RepID=A0A5M8QFK5_9BACT|nr:hypothetical protein [Rufibacter glacialis]KAA6433546.1 hypothetical protein FOE74_13885 [Rufibacter glacialis]GGK73170.1 hypothetical protein GCM10011405_21620 [Rufibacter glacialis]